MKFNQNMWGEIATLIRFCIEWNTKQKGFPMAGQILPFTTINEYPDGKGSKLVISKSIPYILTPHKEYGHLVCLPDYVSGKAMVIGVAETFDKGVKFTQTLDKDHLLEVA